MKRPTALASEGRARRLVPGTLLLAGLALLTQMRLASSDADPGPAAGGSAGNINSAAVTAPLVHGALTAVAADRSSNPAKIMGAKACIQCHRSEYLAWLSTKHSRTEATIADFSGNTASYAEALGIEQKDVLKHSLCASCHATTQTDLTGKVRAISGVSCESCHGASGGDDGWLNRHAVYGPNVTRIDQETAAHRAARIDYCTSGGMVRAANLYGIAKSCLSCHSVTNEKLVNAGHGAGGGFELIGWSIGEVRHNFHMDQTANAEGPSLLQQATGGKAEGRKRVKFIVGTLANAEVSLAALGAATAGDSDYVEAHIERVLLSMEILGGVLDYLEDAAPEELAEVMEIIEEAEIEDTDFGEQDGRDKARSAARRIAAIAVKFAARDGSKLAAIDVFMNEEVVAVKGKPYSRKP